jgi:hypothetical protein
MSAGPLGRGGRGWDPVPGGLLQVSHGHALRAVEIGDRAGDSEQALGGPGGQAGCVGQADCGSLGPRIEPARGPERTTGEPARDAAARIDLVRPDRGNPRRDRRRRFAVLAGQERLRRYPWHADPEVETVAERPGDPCRVSVREAQGAGAAPGRVRGPSARASVKN